MSDSGEPVYDCDDSAALAYPGAEEICNDGADNDCDGDPTDCILVGAFSLDASEHALVGPAAGDRAGEVIAGTTGSGKSELLRSLVAGLAEPIGALAG